MAKKSIAASASAFLQKAVTLPAESTSFLESFEATKPALMNGFRGMFGESKLSSQEEIHLKQLLNDHYDSSHMAEDGFDEDFQTLARLTSEIKAINNQSILLHGERIKRAQDVLKNYREGAFTAWLISTYGNRQTPYSMLYYYEFYHALPFDLRTMIENIPKKAAYTLASREGSFDLKLELIRNYKGQKQDVFISLIQNTFPKSPLDQRNKKRKSPIFDQIEKLILQIESQKKFTPDEFQKLNSFSERLSRLCLKK